MIKKKISSLLGFFHLELNYKRGNFSIKFILEIAIPIILITLIIKYIAF